MWLRLVDERDEIDLLATVGDHKLARVVLDRPRGLVVPFSPRLQRRLERRGPAGAVGGAQIEDLSDLGRRDESAAPAESPRTPTDFPIESTWPSARRARGCRTEA